MIAGRTRPATPSTTAPARSLKANGELSGEPLVVSGREFMVGDEVVARRNERHLHAGWGT